MKPSLALYFLTDVPLIQPGDDLPAIIADCLQKAQAPIDNSSVLVVAAKVVSRAEGRMVRLETVTASSEAAELAEVCHIDPRVVELILRESIGISRIGHQLLYVIHRLGYVCDRAGIDFGNTGSGDRSQVILLPRDPDRSADRIRTAIVAKFGIDIGVVISDSFHNRAFRRGSLEAAIGISGVPAMIIPDKPIEDLYGLPQRMETAIADQLAIAAGLVTANKSGGKPVVLITGLQYERVESSFRDLLRPLELDLYR